MSIYIIIHANGNQTVAQLDRYDDIMLKYPEEFLAAIKLEDSVVEDIKNDNFLTPGENM